MAKKKATKKKATKKRATKKRATKKRATKKRATRKRSGGKAMKRKLPLSAAQLEEDGGNAVKSLLRRDDVQTARPASAAQIKAVTGRFKHGEIPEALTKLWQASDGVRLDEMNAHILGPSEVLEVLDAWSPEYTGRGFLPFLDSHQSNYLVVAVLKPLAPRVVYLPHDDGSRVLYRNVESCVRSLIEAMKDGMDADDLLHDSEGDYPPDAPRPKADQAAARALIATDGKHDEWNYAVQLLDASNAEEWAKLLETDHFVRRDVRARMERMASPAISKKVRKDTDDFEGFAKKVASAARKAGLKVGKQDGECLQVGGCWMDLEAFFHRRHVPNAMERTIAWFQDLIAGRNPHHRPGHLLTDE